VHPWRQNHDGFFANWTDSPGTAAVMVCPDRYVFGIAADDTHLVLQNDPLLERLAA